MPWFRWPFGGDGVYRGHQLGRRNGINDLREKVDLRQPISPNRHRFGKSAGGAELLDF